MIFPLLGLTELALGSFFAQRAPRPAEWGKVRPLVERAVAKAPLIVVAPHWAEPSARAALGDALMPLDHVARADESRFEAALELSVMGASAPELEGWKLEAEETHGEFRLRRFTNPAYRPVLVDFVERVEAASLEVFAGTGDGPRPCPFTTRAKVSNGDLHGHPTFPARRFDCPGGGDWFFVGRTVIEDERYRPRRCIWAHPSDAGPLTLVFRDVPLGARLEGHGGLPYWNEREQRGRPVRIEVAVGDEVLGHWEHADGEGWKPFAFDTSRFAGRSATVVFRVSTTRAWRRELCFEATAR